MHSQPTKFQPRDARRYLYFQLFHQGAPFAGHGPESVHTRVGTPASSWRGGNMDLGGVLATQFHRDRFAKYPGSSIRGCLLRSGPFLNILLFSPFCKSLLPPLKPADVYSSPFICHQSLLQIFLLLQRVRRGRGNG